MMEAPGSSETSVLIRAIRRDIAEDDFRHIDCSEILKSYRALTDWTLAER
jgi:hypothetical protein